MSPCGWYFPITSPTIAADLRYGRSLRSPHLVHRPQDPALHRLEPVAHVGQSARDDDRHGVVEVRLPHLLFELDANDPLVTRLADHVVPCSILRLRPRVTLIAVARSLRASVLPHSLLALHLRADTRERFLRPGVTPFEPAPAVRGHAQEGRVGLGEHLAVGRPRKGAARLEQPAAVARDLAHDSQLLTHLRRMPEGDVDAGGHSPDPLV